ncbi:AraC-like DNA-binding protein [Saccharothrix ecbatanensis]|uniref:AraC-like DNA-binding protein n=1 Tax=Saccharothrix ecbatanensis TaxID=1105145 RepID=A0A7W9M0Z5_9PSEU|nr:helix-turn-helix domain-containing protein [Saccharothrix ecbatanensis]MBB5803292.1 AraC-like DNA-binding protein [Saccharothrix ecbatanensis]
MTEFSNEDLSVDDQMACWLEAMDHDLVPTRLHRVTEGGFPASARTLAWDGVRVSALTYPSVWVERTAKLIRRSDPEAYQVNLLLDGKAAIRQAGREARFGVGEFAFFTTSRPFHGWRSCGLRTRSVTLQISRTLLPLPARQVDQLAASPFDARHGMGAAFAHWLTDLTARADEFTPDDATTLTSVTVDLLAAVLAAPLDAEKTLTPESRRRALRLQVHRFIEQRLGDPALTPTTVGRAHHLSLRTLQQLFAEDDTSPAAWIRHRRLERCRRDLSNPHLGRRPIHTIATRWGFTDPAHFSRLFRTTYHMAPSDYRRHALPRE